jgi:hypothetical protein
MGAAKKSLVEIDDPVIIKRYGGMTIYQYVRNGQCQDHISVKPIGGRADDHFGVDGGSCFRPIENDKIIFKERLGDKLPKVTTVYGRDLTGSVCNHISKNYKFYFGERDHKKMEKKAVKLVWLKAINYHLFTQFHAPDQKARAAPIAKTAKWTKADAVMGAIDCYFPWDLSGGHIFDFLRMPVYTNEASRKFVEGIDKQSAAMLWYVGKAIFELGTSDTDSDPYRCAATPGKIQYVFHTSRLQYKVMGDNYYNKGGNEWIVGDKRTAGTFAEPNYILWDKTLWHLKKALTVQKRVRRLRDEGVEIGAAI